jgi:clan AA aspartic protease (TIGR02281 family)
LALGAALLAGAVPAAAGEIPGPTVITPSPSGSPGVTVIRPAPPPRSLTLRAQGGGHFLHHFVLTAEVDGTPVRFLVDTGASFVTLSLADADAVGIRRSDLVFDHRLQTADGRIPAALVRLHDITVGDLSVEGVAAAVGDIKPSVLGMNFLNRLKRFEIDGDTLTLEW